MFLSNFGPLSHYGVINSSPYSRESIVKSMKLGYTHFMAVTQHDWVVFVNHDIIHINY